MTYILIILFALSKHFRDEIAYHPTKLPKWEWLVSNNWRTNSWWLKNPFSMFLDGWNFMEFINVMSTSLLFCIASDINLLWAIGVYALIGLIHSLLDGSLLR